jgi:hypothetical protein
MIIDVLSNYVWIYENLSSWTFWKILGNDENQIKRLKRKYISKKKGEGKYLERGGGEGRFLCLSKLRI